MSDKKSFSFSKLIVSLLTVAFVILKIIGVFKYSWLLVFSPIWIYLLFVVFFIVVFSAISVLKKQNNRMNTLGKSEFQQRLDEYVKQQQAKSK